MSSLAGGTDSARPYGPEEHKQARRDLGLAKVEDILAMGYRNNDPFFMGTESHWRDARWFAGLWQQFGFGRGTHLRRVHYVVSQSGGLDVDGSPYRNEAGAWHRLSEASKRARYLGLVDPEDFTDRRNSGVQQHVFPRQQAEPRAEITRSGGVWVPYVPDPPLLDDDDRAHAMYPAAEVSGYETGRADQPVLLELWVEKSAVNDVLEPVCADLGLNLKVAMGYESITSAVELLRRAEAVGKPVHVFYVSDLDRAGEGMPVAVARQCEFWAPKLNVGVPVSLERLALTTSQVARYALPQAPDSGDTELDALEALHPGELARIVRAAVRPWRDDSLYSRMSAARREAAALVDERLREATRGLYDEVPSISDDAAAVLRRAREQLGPLAEQWEQIAAAADEELAEIRRRGQAVADRVRHAVAEVELDLPPRPEAEPPDVDRSGLLYDSGRDWVEQVAHYQAARRRGGAP